jgi:hypothetical protein
LASTEFGKRRDGVIGCSVKMPLPELMPEANRTFQAAPLKEQRRQDCARRHWPAL